MSALPKFCVHLLSGGLDSSVLLHDLVRQGCKVHCLLFHYGQRHQQELSFAVSQAHYAGCFWKRLNIPELKGSSLTDGQGGVIVPLRNAVFLSIAASVAASVKADCVTFAANADDAAEFPDCRKDFVKAMNAALKASEINVEICAPYIDKTKKEIVAIGNKLGVKIYETWSCYEGGVKPCGKCLACIKRQEALA